MLFGKKIRELRKQKGISLRKFAQVVDISTTYLSVIETGEIVPSEDKIRTIAKALGIDEDELLHAGGKISTEIITIILKNPREFARAIRAMARLSAPQIEKMAEALNSKI